ncbi:MAG: SRPBCC family protein [Cyanobacteria bacterium J06632_22]
MSQDILQPLQNSPEDSSIDAALSGVEPIRLDATSEEVSVSTEKVEGRKRKISASIAIPVALEPIWALLTDYDRLADYIPNLTVSRQVEHPKGGIRLEQVGAQCFLNIKFCARVLLDMQERFPREIGFSMVEGDFKQFLGRWRLQPALIGEQPGTLLSYEVIVQPPLAMPARLIEHHLCHNLTENLLAIRQHATALA